MSDLFRNNVLGVGKPFVDKVSPEEVTTIMAHELGHREHFDVHQSLVAKLLIRNAVTAFFINGNQILYVSILFETDPIIGALPISDIFLH